MSSRSRGSVGPSEGLAPPIVSEVLWAPGMPLAAETRAAFEMSLDHDFSRVRVHADPRAARSAREVNALAYTVGSQIVFGEGQYAPTMTAGRRLLRHELIHTIQQENASTGGPLEIASSDTAAEREAQQAGSRVSPRPMSLSRIRVQRQVGAECVAAMNDPVPSDAATGIAVEKKIVDHLEARHGPNQRHSLPGASSEPLRTEGRRRVIPPQVFDDRSGSLRGVGRPDVAYRSETGRVILLAEIKPANWTQLALGESQLLNYIDKGNAPDNADVRKQLGIDVFSPMLPGGRIQPPVSVSLGPRRFAVMWCGPGMIVYRESRRRRRRRRQPETRPVPVPVPESVPVPKRRPQPVPEGRERPTEPVPSPEEQPEGQPVEAPDNVVPFPGRHPKPADEPQPEGEEELLPQAARVALLAALATALYQISRQSARQAGRQAARRALVYAEMVALVGIVVLYSDRVEARVGPGESPLETLFKAMAQDGVPIPAELRQRIESDPQLRELMERAAKTGDLNAAQRELSRQMMAVIASNPEAFTEEDLQILMEASQAAGANAPGMKPTVETLRRAIEAKRRNDPIAPVVRPGPAAESGAEAAEYRGISGERRARLAEHQPVKDLFDAMVEKSGNGPAVDDSVADRFLATVPADLTKEESRRLIDGMRPVEGRSLDEILGSLQAAVDSLRGTSGEGEAALPEDEGPAATQGTEPTRRPSGEGKVASTTEVGRKIAELLGKKPRPDVVVVRESELKVGETLQRFMARRRGNFLVAAFLIFTPLSRKKPGVWKVRVDPVNWFNVGGEFVERWPERPAETELTMIKINQ